MLARRAVHRGLRPSLSQLVLLRVVVRGLLSPELRIVHKGYSVPLEVETCRVLFLSLAEVGLVAGRRRELVLLLEGCDIIGHGSAGRLVKIAFVVLRDHVANDLVVGGRDEFLDPQFVVDVGVSLAGEDLLNLGIFERTIVCWSVAFNSKSFVPFQAILDVVFDRDR